MDHADSVVAGIALDRSGWGRIGFSWIPTTALVIGGLAAFAHQVSSAGSAVWAWVALGIYVVGALAWFFGVLLQTAVGGAAADSRAASGATPE